MSATKSPILYTFRRCPYAMRARLAIAISEIKVEEREVALSNKPAELLVCSPKATVPVLELVDKTVIDESRDIMLWALKQKDPQGWLLASTEETDRLINFNDDNFKEYLDSYKYSSRFPEEKMEVFREKGEEFLKVLEEYLNKSKYLLSDSVSLADMAIFPFIRQFAYVDQDWFAQSEYVKLQLWLKGIQNTSLFQRIMEKQPVWVSKQGNS